MLTEQQLAFLRSEPGSNRVAKAMALAGVTQATVAKALGLTQPYVSDVARRALSHHYRRERLEVGRLLRLPYRGFVPVTPPTVGLKSRRHFSPARMLAPRDDRDGGAGRTAPLSCCCLMPLPGRRFAITFGASSPRALWSTRRSAARSGHVCQDCPPPWTIRAPSAQQVALGQPEARPVLQSWNAWHASCFRVKVTGETKPVELDAGGQSFTHYSDSSDADQRADDGPRPERALRGRFSIPER